MFHNLRSRYVLVVFRRDISFRKSHLLAKSCTLVIVGEATLLRESSKLFEWSYLQV